MTREADTKRHLRPAPFPEMSLGEYLPAGGARPQTASPTAAPGSMSALASAIERLEEAIDQETEALENFDDSGFEDFNRRKSQSLLELTRLSRALPAGWEHQLGDDMRRVQGKLQRNQEAVNLHLTAVKEIADLVASAIHESESDGTYGMSAHRANGYGA